jgi:predicted RecB family nuclease
MSPEYEQIFNHHGGIGSHVPMGKLRWAIEECEALANKPQVRLSSGELIAIISNSYLDTAKMKAEAVQDAVLAAQPNAPKPVDVPFDFEKWVSKEWNLFLDGCTVEYFDRNTDINRYTLRRK